MHMSGCAGKHIYDVGIMGNGALAGLVAITSGTSTIYPWGAIIVGFIAGAWYCLGSQVSVWLKVSYRYIFNSPMSRKSAILAEMIGSANGKSPLPAMLAAAALIVCDQSVLINYSYMSKWLALCRRGHCLQMFLDTPSAACTRMVLTGYFMVMQWDDPLDAIAVHAWNGLWGVIAVGMFAAPDLITNSYGTGVFDGAQRPYGFIFSGSDGHLLVAQICYALFITSASRGPLCPHMSVASTLPPVSTRVCCNSWEVQTWVSSLTSLRGHAIPAHRSKMSSSECHTLI